MAAKAAEDSAVAAKAAVLEAAGVTVVAMAEAVATAGAPRASATLRHPKLQPYVNQ